MTNSGDQEETQSPPSYQEALADVSVDNAIVRDDGRIDVNINSRLSRTLSRLIRPPPPYEAEPAPTAPVGPDTFPVRLNIVIHVVGSRGDVQPFVALGQALRKHGHRIRLATHEKFRNFVRDSGLEFYSIGGDPEDLMAYMVKNPGLMPSMQSLRAGDIARKRKMVAEMLDGCWQSCVEPDETTGVPFVADAIIANPPSFAHLHCAEALGIPIHIIFTMPWTGTTAFPHPLANIKGGNDDPRTANWMTYALVEWMTWQGLGDLINTWREKLGLEPVPMTEGPMLAQTLKIPHTYCWSPALVPKPKDWGSHIDVSGFFFRETQDYKPNKDLSDFLEAGPPPIYIGFGSIVLEDAARFSSAIIDAITQCGQRAIISPGWSKLCVPEDRADIMKLEECPHEWLFQHVSMVMHHGGAGTTAIGLREARPTIIVPFFGDQPFWAKMVAAAGAGPKPIPQREVKAQKLAEAIRFCESDETKSAAASLAAQIKQEDGVAAAVRSIHANLPLRNLRCDMLPNEPASWYIKLQGKRVKISRAAAEVLTQDVGLNAKNLKAYSPKPIVITNRRYDPVSGTLSSVIGIGAGMLDSATGIVRKPGEEYFRGRSKKKATSAPISPDPSQIRSSAVTTRSNDTSMDLDDAASETSSLVVPESKALVQKSTDTSDSKSQLSKGGDSNQHVAVSMAAASGKSLGKFFSNFARGAFVEMPLATAEGFRNLPRAWGEEVRDYGAVTDWQSGGIVAGKTLVQGMGHGFRDLTMHPVKGAQEGGFLGAAKGVATGSASFLTKFGTAGLGLVAYPGQGIAKSLHSWAHSDAAKDIAIARREEGRAAASRLSEMERMAIVDTYHDLQRKGTQVWEGT